MSEAASPRRRRMLAVVVLSGTMLALAAVLVTAVLNHSLSYYRTPTELMNSPQGSHSVRVEGMVVAGTVHHSGAQVRFVITDGAHQLHVVTNDAPPSTFRPGQGAVVEGRLLPGGVFDANQVLVRHSNEYRAPGSTQEAPAGSP